MKKVFTLVLTVCVILQAIYILYWHSSDRSAQKASEQSVRVELSGPKTLGFVGAHRDSSGRTILEFARANLYKPTKDTAKQARYDRLFSNFKIYRKVDRKFLYTKHKEEYFWNYGSFHEFELIHEGPLRSYNTRWYKYIDTSAIPGNTYVYYVQPGESTPVGPIALRLRPLSTWWDTTKLHRTIQDLELRYPELVTSGIAGHTRYGASMPYVTIGRKGPVIMLIGGIHAGESGPEMVLPPLQELLERNPRLFHRVRFVALPMMNIDTRQKLAEGNPWYLRKNKLGHGVDLNRNFPSADWRHEDISYGQSTTHTSAETYRGPYPASEPETRAVMHLLEKFRPKAVFSFHCMAGLASYPLNYSIGVNDWDDWESRDSIYEKQAASLARVYGEAFSDGATKHANYGRPSIKPGTLESYVREKYKVPAFAVEGHHHGPEKKASLDEVSPAIMKRYQEKAALGFQAVAQFFSRDPA